MVEVLLSQPPYHSRQSCGTNASWHSGDKKTSFGMVNENTPRGPSLPLQARPEGDQAKAKSSPLAKLHSNCRRAIARNKIQRQRRQQSFKVHNAKCRGISRIAARSGSTQGCAVTQR